MKHASNKKSTLQADNRDNIIIKDGREILANAGFAEDDIDLFAANMVDIMDDYADHFGEGTEVEYSITKRFGRMEARLSIAGEQFDPFENGNNSKQRKIEKLLNVDLGSQEPGVSYKYSSGCNIVVGSAPLEKKKKSILKSPMLWAVIIGVAVGIICLFLPEDVNHFIIEELLGPVMNVLLDVLAGIMGPVIFLSLVSSIISLNSINELTNLGTKIIKRFILIILFVIVVSIGISLIFFSNFGPGGVDFSLNQIITMLLGIIPINIVSPFLENNTPQLVVLAFVTGVALLMLADRTPDLIKNIHQLNEWIMRVMKFVLKLVPLIPFLSIATVIGRGNAGVLIEGWKFIAASYIVYTLCPVIKLIKTSIKTKIPILDLLKKMFPALKTAFATSSKAAPLKQIYDISEKEYHIKKEFSSLWVPMSYAMLALQTTINVVLASFMMTEILGLPISFSFLFVLTLLTLEMSLASPGTTSSWVIAFEAFSMPTSYVGLFSTYRLFTRNYSTAAALSYTICEEVEMAYKMDAIET